MKPFFRKLRYASAHHIVWLLYDMGNAVLKLLGPNDKGLYNRAVNRVYGFLAYYSTRTQLMNSVEGPWTRQQIVQLYWKRRL